jgi:hypothetical protein
VGRYAAICNFTILALDGVAKLTTRSANYRITDVARESGVLRRNPKNRAA